MVQQGLWGAGRMSSREEGRRIRQAGLLVAGCVAANAQDSARSVFAMYGSCPEEADNSAIHVCCPGMLPVCDSQLPGISILPPVQCVSDGCQHQQAR